MWRPPGMVLVSIVLLAVCIFGTYWLSALPGMREQHRAHTRAAPQTATPALAVVPRTPHPRSHHRARHHAAATANAATHASAMLSAPQPLYAPPPPYPISALRARSQGRVILHLTLARNGHVASVRVVHSSGDAALDEAADRTVGSWVFPPPPAGAPRSFDWPVRFRIDSHE